MVIFYTLDLHPATLYQYIMFKDRRELLPTISPRYFPFPADPETIIIDGIPAYKYVDETDIQKLIMDFRSQINLNWYEAIFLNREGGIPFGVDVANGHPVGFIKYKEDGEISIPIPGRLKYARILVLDDIYDTGITGSLIKLDAPNARLVYLTRKRDVPNLRSLEDTVWLSEIDKIWALGKGMNGEQPGDGLPVDWGRTFPGIAAKIL